jgi:hypothetical protein
MRERVRLRRQIQRRDGYRRIEKKARKIRDS